MSLVLYERNVGGGLVFQKTGWSIWVGAYLTFCELVLILLGNILYSMKIYVHSLGVTDLRYHPQTP